MLWRRNFLAVHRWVGLVVGVQLLIWSSGGFVFSLLDLDDVHGDLNRNAARHPELRLGQVRLTPMEAATVAQASGISIDSLTRIDLRQLRDRTVFKLIDNRGKPLAVVDAASGELVPPISELEAKEIAIRDFVPQAPITSIALLEGDPPVEFRGGPMPVYRVILDHPKNPHIFVSPITGEVLKRRNKPWRIFDFFWMLHTMDYGGRDNFNHWLLSAAALLAIITSTSGLVLWWWRLPRGKGSGVFLPQR